MKDIYREKNEAEDWLASQKYWAEAKREFVAITPSGGEVRCLWLDVAFGIFTVIDERFKEAFGKKMLMLNQFDDLFIGVKD